MSGLKLHNRGTQLLTAGPKRQGAIERIESRNEPPQRHEYCEVFSHGLVGKLIEEGWRFPRAPG